MNAPIFDNGEIVVKPLSYDINDIKIYPSFIALSVDWFSLPLEYRLSLKLELIGEPIYYPEEVNFLDLIIPVDNGKVNDTEAFLFLSEFPTFDGKEHNAPIIAELEKLTQGKETGITDFCKRISLTDDSKLLTLSARIEPFDISNL